MNAAISGVKNFSKLREVRADSPTAKGGDSQGKNRHVRKITKSINKYINIPKTHVKYSSKKPRGILDICLIIRTNRKPLVAIDRPNKGLWAVKP